MALPKLKLPTQMPANSAQRIYLAHVVEQYKLGVPVPFSQRGGRKLFNRGGGRLVSRDLKALRIGGWLTARQLGETEALGYCPGPKLVGNPELLAEWQAFSAALFGVGGLVKRFVNSPIWGHDVFGFNQTLVVGAIVYRNQGLRRIDVISYLNGLVGISSVDSALRKLVESQVVVKKAGSYQRNKNWNSYLEALLRTHVGGFARKERIAREVRIDRIIYSGILRRGQMTPRQRRSLLRKPCLRCGKKATQVEHFPPKKYGGKDHIHLVWAICTKCNKRTQAFIRSLGPLGPPNESTLRVTVAIDPNILLRASLATGLRHFYMAAARKDRLGGLRIVANACQLVYAIESKSQLSSRRPVGRPSRPRRLQKRQRKGGKPLVRESSRPKY